MVTISSNQEDYLKTIYLENIKGKVLTNKRIAEMMHVSAPSASDMLSKLLKQDLLHKDKNLGFKLSKQGINLTQNLLRKHRIWEVFLIDKLGYTWDEVHEDADILEHMTSSRLMDRLNDYLNKPQFCPHGKVIYGNGIEKNFNTVVSLSELKVGDKGSVHILEDDRLLLQYLSQKKIKIHDVFEVVSINDFDQSMNLNMKGHTAEISYPAAQMIFVRKAATTS